MPGGLPGLNTHPADLVPFQMNDDVPRLRDIVIPKNKCTGVSFHLKSHQNVLETNVGSHFFPPIMDSSRKIMHLIFASLSSFVGKSLRTS